MAHHGLFIFGLEQAISAFAATIGGLISALAVIPLPFDVASIVCSGLMVRRFLLPRRERGHVLGN
ncbi:MAG: hypothetical protein U0802_20485 [Candidatus Binatia bacterium]